MNDLEFEWSQYHENIAYHEGHHAIVCHVLGGTVLEVAIGPPVIADRGDRLSVGYCEFDRETLSPFHRLCVAVAGEVGEAHIFNSPVDFTSPHLGGDMKTARAAVAEIVGCPVDDIENLNCFRFAVVKAQSILKRYPLALTSIAFRLQRPPFSIHGDAFSLLMERLSVVKEH